MSTVCSPSRRADDTEARGRGREKGSGLEGVKVCSNIGGGLRGLEIGFGKVYLESEVLKSIESELGSSDGIVIGRSDYQQLVCVWEYDNTLKMEVGSHRCHAFGKSPWYHGKSKWERAKLV